MARRHYSSIAARTTLASGVDDTTTTFVVVAVSNWPASYPYTLIVDQDTVNEEIVEVTGRSGTTLTVTRGVDGSSAVAHSSGAAVNHGVSARDFDEPNEFINGTGVVTESMLASDSVTSAKIVDGTIVNADINASAAIAQSKIADLTSDLGSKADLADVEGAATGLFYKASFNTVAFAKTGAGTADIKAGTKVWVNDTVVTFATATSITMPSLTAGTDYFIYVIDDGSVEAVAATGTWPTPVAAPPADSRLIGGFHYAPGGNATGTSGGNTTPAINEYSFWDLKWRPAAPDPRGMTLVNDHFWSDIYLLNTTASTNGTSANNKTIYDTQSWWDTAEELGKYGKRHPRYREFCDLAYGTTENQSRGNDPVTTGLGTTNTGSSNTDEEFTSKWGVIQATGCLYVWGDEFGGGNAAASWADINGGRGRVYQQENAVILGGGWFNTVNSGSRSSLWSDSPSSLDSFISGRGVCDHLRLV